MGGLSNSFAFSLHDIFNFSICCYKFRWRSNLLFLPAFRAMDQGSNLSAVSTQDLVALLYQVLAELVFRLSNFQASAAHHPPPQPPPVATGSSASTSRRRQIRCWETCDYCVARCGRDKPDHRHHSCFQHRRRCDSDFQDEP